MGNREERGDRGEGRIIIGTRGSDLALWQSEQVAGMLRAAHPDLEVELRVIETKGDRVLDVALSRIGDKGLFTKELENALLSGEADIAVHSLKDLQTEIPEGLSLACITERAEPEDALVAPAGTTIASLPEGGTVATGSLRRRAQLLALRPDLQIVDVRGNVGTRLGKYRENGWDGMILARAGLVRLGLEDEIAEVIDPETMVPAVGQGALGIEIREGDQGVSHLLRAIEHRPTHITSEAERAFLRHLEGGCQAPIGAYATLRAAEGDEDREGYPVRYSIELHGLIASLDGTTIFRDSISRLISDNPDEADSIGIELADRMLAEGGRGVLREIYGTSM